MDKPDMDAAQDALNYAREIATANMGHDMPSTRHVFVEQYDGFQGWVAMVVCKRCNAILAFDTDGDALFGLAKVQLCAGRS